jgi:hypothetical protein
VHSIKIGPTLPRTVPLAFHGRHPRATTVNPPLPGGADNECA